MQTINDLSNKCFSDWMANVLQGKVAGKIIAIDGKTICSTSKLSNNGKALHIASAIISEYGFVIASKDCNGNLYDTESFSNILQYLRECDT